MLPSSLQLMSVLQHPRRTADTLVVCFADGLLARKPLLAVPRTPMLPLRMQLAKVSLAT